MIYGGKVVKRMTSKKCADSAFPALSKIASEYSATDRKPVDLWRLLQQSSDAWWHPAFDARLRLRDRLRPEPESIEVGPDKARLALGFGDGLTEVSNRLAQRDQLDAAGKHDRLGKAPRPIRPSGHGCRPFGRPLAARARSGCAPATPPGRAAASSFRPWPYTEAGSPTCAPGWRRAWQHEAGCLSA